MTAVFSYDFLNQVDMRCKNLKAEAIWLKNDISGEYERLTNGGSGPISLPYYLKTNNIKIDQDTNSSNLSPTGLDIIDSTSTETLTKDKLNILTQLKTNLIDPVVPYAGYSDYLPIYSKTTGLFSRAKEFYFGDGFRYGYFGQSSAKYYFSSNSTTLSPTLLNFITPAGGAALNYNNVKTLINLNTNSYLNPTLISTKMVVFDASTKLYNFTDLPAAGSTVPYYIQPTLLEMTNGDGLSKASIISLADTSGGCKFSCNYVSGGPYNARCFMNHDGITMSKTGSPINYSLTATDVGTVNKLTNITQTTSGSNTKLVVKDSVTNNYNTIDIPTGVAVPSYIQTKSILFDEGNTNYMQMDNDSFIKSAGADACQALIQNGKVYLSDFFDPGATPIITLQNDKFTFEDGIGGTTILDKKLIDNIPKKYKLTVPGYPSWQRTASSSIISGEVDFGSDDLTNFPIKNIGDTAIIDMSSYGAATFSGEGLVFTADVFEIMFNPSFDIKYSGAGNFTQQIIKVKSGPSSSKIASCYIGISGVSGNFNGFLTITVKEGVNYNHPGLNIVSGWPADGIPP